MDLGPVADFALMERSGRTIARADLEGKVWIAAFIFTRCAGPCSQVSGSMARLQHELGDQSDVRLVSFTVDPEYDSPKILTEYAKRFGADPERWLFLTGPKKQVSELIVGSFHLAVEETKGPDRKPGYEVTHSTKLALVDRHGHIRGYFDGAPTQGAGDDMARLVSAAEKLLREMTTPADVVLVTDVTFSIHPNYEAIPSLNAALNGGSAILLILGYSAVRRRRIQLHKACMLAALAVSAAFLASYLYYHLVVMAGKPTRFSDRAPYAPTWVQSAYLIILLTHTVLAAAVAPLAIITATFGLRNRIARHTRLARWTLPIWLYVSITGVVVYWMLYRLYPAP